MPFVGAPFLCCFNNVLTILQRCSLYLFCTVPKKVTSMAWLFGFVAFLSLGLTFTPFATSESGNAIYGMRRETDQYLCFIADQGDDQAERQRVLLAELAGEKPQRTVPNIPVVCILTQ